MEILAAAQTQTSPFQSAPVQQAPQYQQYQNTMQQPSGPVYKPSLMVQTFRYGMFIFNICIIIFVIVMSYRFVRATEKIADRIEKGLVVKKEDATT